MRQRRWWIGLMALAAASGGIACGSDDEPEETVAVEGAPTVEEEAAASAEPEHGGTVVAAGRYPVEVVPHASGEVYAYVLGDPPPADLELTVEVPVAGRSTGRPVRMRWNARQGRFEGRVRRVEIVEGPIDVLVVVGGAEYHGHVDVCVILPAIEVHVIEHHHHGKHKHKHKHRGHGWGHGRGHGGVIHIR